MSRTGKSIETESCLMVMLGSGRWERYGVTADGY